MLSKENMSDAKALALCKAFYVCNGDLTEILKYFEVSVDALKHLIDTQGWARLKKAQAPKPALIWMPKHRKMAYYLYHVDQISKLRIGSLFGCSECTVHNLSIADQWRRDSKSIGQEKARCLSQKSIGVICDKYAGGETLGSISSSLGFKSNGPVRRILKERNLFDNRHTYTFDPIFLHKVQKHYAKGEGISRIAKLNNLDPSVVQRLLLSQGVVLRSPLEQNILLAEEKWKSNRTDLNGYCLYKNDIRLLSDEMYKIYYPQINPSGLVRGTDFHLDHWYPIDSVLRNPANLRNPINIWEVSHPANLRIIPASHNLKKRNSLEITAKRLRELVHAWNHKYYDPYYICNSPLTTRLLTYYGAYDGFFGIKGDKLKDHYAGTHWSINQ